MLFGKKNKTSTVSQELVAVQQERDNLLNATDNYFMHEAYKSLRTNVNFALADSEEDKSKIIIITSSFQGEGKSFTSVNLAISYAQTDKKVLIIDCDLRRPKLHRLLQITAPFGLSNILVSFNLLSESIHNTNINGVDAIFAGDIPPNPSELLGSARMEKLLDWAKENYDYVILDTPPITAVTDTSVLAPKTDGVIIVVRAEKAERPAVVQTVHQLQYAQAKILGFVLNGVPIDNNGYGYRKYSRYYRKGYYRYDNSTK